MRAKADVYRFPPTHLKMSLSMYTSPRRIKCGDAYSKSATTKIGVLAGCPIAMGLLLLANLDPIDDFWDKLPKHIYQSISNIKVYVDDFIIVFKFDTNDATNDQIRIRVKGACTRLTESVRRSGGDFFWW